jgi:3-(3-hydroxy-phenyl)propionate hydroxylase
MPDDAVTPAATRTLTAATGGHYELPVYPFVEPAELRGRLGRHPVVIVGGGLTGLSAACDLALRGIPAILLDEDDTVGVRGASSRGICYAQKTLEIFKRLGIYERVAAKGVQWSVGRTFAGDDEVYAFDLKQQRTHDVSEQPPFINLQQFYIEWFLVDRIYELGTVELRWKNRITGVRVFDDHVALDVDTPAGRYTCEALWLIDCTGAHSPIASQLGIGATTHKQIDRWCISDVRFRTHPPAERWTWIEAPFNDNRAVWQHLMADDVWRLDYQMPADADPDEIARPEVVRERLQRQFGADVAFELIWVGPYAYRSRCLDTFQFGRVFFAGDAAHVMSPFGARGGNSGVQDADNLVWKLVLVLQGLAPLALLASYDAERRYAAQQNIRITNRTARFLSPPTAAERVLRDAVIALAREHPFARSFVNTGRLSSPTQYANSPLNASAGAGRHVQNVALELVDDAGAARPADLVSVLEAFDYRFLLLLFAPLDAAAMRRIAQLSVRYPVQGVSVIAAGDAPKDIVATPLPCVRDSKHLLKNQCGAAACALVRPDLYLAAAFERADVTAMEKAIRVALGAA